MEVISSKKIMLWYDFLLFLKKIHYMDLPCVDVGVVVSTRILSLVWRNEEAYTRKSMAWKCFKDNIDVMDNT